MRPSRRWPSWPKPAGRENRPRRRPADSLSAERGLLRAVFPAAPVPLFVLEQDATVRRANTKAGELIGAPPGYATGKPLTAFVDLPSRAAVKSQLAAVARTGKARLVGLPAARPGRPGRGRPWPRTSSRCRTAPACWWCAAASPGPPAAAPAGRTRRPATAAAAPEGRPARHQAMTRRMDMVTAVTRLLLDNSTFSEAVTLQRCARLLAGEHARAG